MDIVLDYSFTVSKEEVSPKADLSYLRKVLAIVKAKEDIAPEKKNIIQTCVSEAEVQALTDCEAWQSLKGGLSSIYALPVDSLDVKAILENAKEKFFTILVDQSFAEITELTIPADYKGVIGWSTSDEAKAEEYAKTQTAFYGLDENKGGNMFFAFGKLLSDTFKWRNQQYITLPHDDKIISLGFAENKFEKRVSFGLTSEQFGPKLAFFANGQKAIIAPYVYENLIVSMQDTALKFMEINKPAYSVANASLLQGLETEQINNYINLGYINSGTVEILANESNFVFNGEIRVSEVGALWRTKCKFIAGGI